MRNLQTYLFVAFFSLVMVLLGGTIFSVMVEYPNWFADVPASLATTRDFYRVLHPGYFFQTIGPLTLLTGIAFVAVGWSSSKVRNLVLVSLALLVAAELLTFIYIYPRLNMLFLELDIHKAETLKQAAAEFTFADRIRTGLGVLGSAFAVSALVRLLRKTGEAIIE